MKPNFKNYKIWRNFLEIRDWVQNFLGSETIFLRFAYPKLAKSVSWGSVTDLQDFCIVMKGTWRWYTDTFLHDEHDSQNGNEFLDSVIPFMHRFAIYIVQSKYLHFSLLLSLYVLFTQLPRLSMDFVLIAIAENMIQWHGTEITNF